MLQNRRLESTYLPAANAEKEAHHIGLLLLLKFLDILEGTHFGCYNDVSNVARVETENSAEDNLLFQLSKRIDKNNPGVLFRKLNVPAYVVMISCRGLVKRFE